MKHLCTLFSPLLICLNAPAPLPQRCLVEVDGACKYWMDGWLKCRYVLRIFVRLFFFLFSFLLFVSVDQRSTPPERVSLDVALDV